MTLKTTLFAAVATLAIMPSAHAYKGLYGKIGAGRTVMQNERDVSNDAVGNAGNLIFDSNADYDNGIGAFAALGYAWGNGFSTELEFSYRNNDIDQIDPDGLGFSGLPNGTISGDTTSLAFMVNALYEFDFGGALGGVRPYLGGGVGIADIDHDITGSNPFGAPTAPLSISFGATQRSLAYQGIAGLAFPLSEGLDFDLSYRYFGTKKDTVEGTLNGAPGEFEVGHNVHSFFAGLRWNFGSAAPAPIEYKDCWDGSSVPLSAACPPEPLEETAIDVDPINFTVYFDYDKSNLTSQAQTLVSEAASRALENDVDTVVVQGNTDTSGGSAYNQALSERRGRAVRDALIANGVSADRIRVEAFGETNPAKPTPDGVREPLNRRADVTISFE